MMEWMSEAPLPTTPPQQEVQNKKARIMEDPMVCSLSGVTIPETPHPDFTFYSSQGIILK